ncbi:MAG: PDZ domain-containing protein [Pirellulales bacterium]
MRQLAPPETRRQYPPRRASCRRRRNRRGEWLTIAAGLGVAFALGGTIREYWPHGDMNGPSSNPSVAKSDPQIPPEKTLDPSVPAETQYASTPVPENVRLHLVGNGGGAPEQTVDVPLTPMDHVDERVLQSWQQAETPATLPPEILNSLRQDGHVVRQQKSWLQVELPDGRRAVGSHRTRDRPTGDAVTSARKSRRRPRACGATTEVARREHGPPFFHTGRFMITARFLTRAAVAALLACGTIAPARRTRKTSPRRPLPSKRTRRPRRSCAGSSNFNGPTRRPTACGSWPSTNRKRRAVVPNDTIIIQRLQDGKLDPATMEKLQAILRQRQAAANEAFRIQTVPQTFWLGVECRPIDPAMRKPLKLDGDAGIVVGRVMDNSPAAKAGIVEGDILLSYVVSTVKSADTDVANGEHDLKTVEQLIDAVQQSGGNVFSVKLRRDGDVKTIEVAPERRTADTYDPAASKRALKDLAQATDQAALAEKRVADWQKQMQAHGFAVPAAPLQAGTFDIVRTAPGFVLPQPPQAAKVKWPDDLRVSIERKGNAPLRITVEHDGKSETVSETELDKLPADLRTTASTSCWVAVRSRSTCNRRWAA